MDALILVRPPLRGDLQLPPRLAVRDVFRRIEDVERASDHFLRRVAFDPLRPARPRLDASVRREEVDGVVADAVDDQPQFRLAMRELIRERRMRLLLIH